jgi:5-methylcytosine-specific restriction endonuclease McrA
MIKYKQIYLKHFGYDTSDFIACENCGAHSVHIHHVDIKGMGGSKNADGIENLIALCYKCHENAHGVMAAAHKIKFKDIISRR